MKCHFYVMEKFCDFFTLRPSDFITTLTYVHMDNFCPCLFEIVKFYYIGKLSKQKSKN